MNKINFLPPWVETNEQPAFYDLESGTCLQQTARMYNKVNQLVRSQNDVLEDVDYLLNWFDNLDIHDQIDAILREYIEDGTFYETLRYDGDTQSLTLTFDIARA